MQLSARLGIPWLLGLAVWCVVASAEAEPGGAEGSSDTEALVSRVVRDWTEAGAHTMRLPPKFLFEDGKAVVALPPSGVPATGCLHVAVLGARGFAFRARFAGASIDPLEPAPLGHAASEGGILELSRCTPQATEGGHLLIASEAGRGAVDIVVGYASSDLTPLTSVLPERTAGVLPKPTTAGQLPAQVSPQKRADRASAQAKRDGASYRGRALLSVARDGAGEHELALSAGCHRVELFAVDPREKRPDLSFRLDLDAELRQSEGDKLLARDRTESPNARLDACLGEAGQVSVIFVGAVPGTHVVATVATWPLPPALPSLWGASAKANMARAVFERHVRELGDGPVFLGQGVSGKTSFPLSLDPSACYVAVASVFRGRAQALQLRASVGAELSVNERGAETQAAAATFCARGQKNGRVEVTARGQALGLGVALFRVAGGVWEDTR